jgi:enhancing lycopene biosynthesis protein 2
MRNVGVVLAGCGFLDGAEIYESVLTLLHLDRLGVNYHCLAPDIPQMHVVNHHTGQPTSETRNVLTEAARIARGKIQPLDNSWVEKLDAVIFPGGFGAAKNYCDYAVSGDACVMNPIVESFMVSMVNAGKPVGVICISPLVLSRALQKTGRRVKLTVGSTSSAAASVEKFGAEHVVCLATDCVVDAENKIVSTPAYMCDARISEASLGIEKMVHEVIRMCDLVPSSGGQKRSVSASGATQ